MSFPRYPDYKDSGDAALGQIPSHWRVARIGDVAKVVNGYPFDSALFHDDGAYPLIRIRDLGVSETATRYSGDFVETAAVTSSDVLIGMDGDFNVGRWLGTGAALLNQRMCCIRTPSPELTKLLEYALPQPLRVINDLTYATTVKHLSSSQIEKIRVALTLDRDELRAIVKFLDRETAKIDALVAEQEKLIALLQEKRQAVISHAVTKGLDPNVPMKDSGVEWLGEVPAHWSVTRIATLFREVSEFGNDDLPILSVSIHDGVSDKELNEAEMDRKVTRSEDRSKYKAVAPGDLTYNMMRAWQGAFGAVTVQGQVSPAYVVARPKSEIQTAFVEQMLRTPKAVEQMRRHSRGVTDFRLRLYWDEFKNIRVALPSVNEQCEILENIASDTGRFDELMAQAQSTITLLQERRTALISAAVTGQIDVRGLAGGANAPDFIASSAMQ